MTIGFIHSTRLVLPWIETAFAPLAARAPALHALDEALIVELAKGRGVTDGALRRIAFMAESLAEAGATRLVLTCSSLSPAVDSIANKLAVPFVKADEAMVDAAVASGKPFVVLATNPSTRQPLALIVEMVAARLGTKPEWRYELVEGAFAELDRGDAEAHDAAVAAAIDRVSASGETVLLAQISMARVLSLLDPAARRITWTSLDRLAETAFGKEAARNDSQPGKAGPGRCDE